MTATEKLANIFTPAFVQENSELSTMDAIYAKVSQIDPEITREELEEFLTSVSKAMNESELSAEDLDSVAGGIGLLAVAGGIAAVAGVFTATYLVGTAIGKFVRNVWG